MLIIERTGNLCYVFEINQDQGKYAHCHYVFYGLLCHDLFENADICTKGTSQTRTARHCPLIEYPLPHMKGQTRDIVNQM